MNSITMERRIRFERDALDHILGRNSEADKSNMARIIAAEAALSPAFARRRARVALGRTLVARASGLVASAGAFVVVGATVGMGLVDFTLSSYLVLMLLAGGALGLFWMVTRNGRPNTALLAGVWAAATLLPVAGFQGEGIDLVLLALGWLAIGARAWLQGRSLQFDRDEIQLMLDAQGREAHVEDMRRKVAAAI